MAAKKSAKATKGKANAKRAAPKKATTTAKKSAGTAPTKSAPKASEPIMRNVTGQLVLNDAKAGLAWYAKVFGAKELSRMPSPDGKILHSTMQLGDTVFMVSDSFGPAPGELSGAFLHIHHKDIHAMWTRATASGAKVILPLQPMFWGDHYGQFRDPFGQMWSLGWPANLTEAQKQKLQAEAMAQMSQR